MTNPKVLVFDIETSPILSYVWGLWDQNIGVSQIKSDWHLLSWAAKWLNDPPFKIKYMDQRHEKNLEDDSRILKGIWKLLNEADVVVTQNGKQFDEKKLNARFILNGMQPPSSYKHVDTKQIAKNKFGFTSNGLEYMSDKICKKYKKLKHAKFSGFELWTQCLARNPKAWKEMEKYNKYDVLALEELYLKLQPWDASINFDVYRDTTGMTCNCGSTKFRKIGFFYTSVAKYQRYRCGSCGGEIRGRNNVLSKKKKENLMVKVK